MHKHTRTFVDTFVYSFYAFIADLYVHEQFTNKIQLWCGLLRKHIYDDDAFLVL